MKDLQSPRSPYEVLAEAEELLGPAVQVHWHRGWADFWCPFHDDAARQGKRGRPNFGVHLVDDGRIPQGAWKCQRCGESGRSLEALRKRLGKGGKGWKPPSPARVQRRPLPPKKPPFHLLAEAMAIAVANFRGSPAERYLAEERHIRPSIAYMYGVGYGIPFPSVPPAVLKAAQAHSLATQRGWWVWAGGVVYAEPPLKPDFIEIRHLRKSSPISHQRVGSPKQPGGAWRVGPSTEIIIVVEGLMDMLSFAQVLHDKGLGNRVIPVFTGGSGNPEIYQWLRRQSAHRDLIIVPDNDKGGRGLLNALRRHKVTGGKVVWPPEGKDPNDAIPEGWWPFPF